ncbi:hypothetical protein [Micromonospora chalcea]|uniref:hypothetical protein n=1 Tax=Micromonospora chalcea TaxID=1874 RepID=UPI00340EDEAA
MAIKRTGSEVDRRRPGNVCLWRDDLAAVVHTLTEVATDIRMSASDFTFDHVDDLAEVKTDRFDMAELSAKKAEFT